MNPVTQLPIGSNCTIPPRDERDWVTRAELTAKSGITARQTDYWTRTGLLTPIADGHRGSGHLQRYLLAEIDRAIAVRELLDAGVCLVTIRSHVDEFIDTGRIVLGPLTIARTTNKEIPTA